MAVQWEPTRGGKIYSHRGPCQDGNKGNILPAFLVLLAGKSSKVTDFPKRVLFYEDVCGTCSVHVSAYEEQVSPLLTPPWPENSVGAHCRACPKKHFIAFSFI